VGIALFAIGAVISRTNASKTIQSAIWMVPWFIGQVVIGALGRYGDAANGERGYEILPPWIDILVMIAFSLGIFYFALHTTLSRDASAAAVAKDAHQLNYEARAA
jgi:hypothetical protein